VVGATVRALAKVSFEFEEIPFFDRRGGVGTEGVVNVEAEEAEVIVRVRTAFAEDTRVDGALSKA